MIGKWYVKCTDAYESGNSGSCIPDYDGLLYPLRVELADALDRLELTNAELVAVRRRAAAQATEFSRRLDKVRETIEQLTLTLDEVTRERDELLESTRNHEGLQDYGSSGKAHEYDEVGSNGE